MNAKFSWPLKHSTNRVYTPLSEFVWLILLALHVHLFGSLSWAQDGEVSPVISRAKPKLTHITIRRQFARLAHPWSVLPSSSKLKPNSIAAVIQFTDSPVKEKNRNPWAQSHRWLTSKKKKTSPNHYPADNDETRLLHPLQEVKFAGQWSVGRDLRQCRGPQVGFITGYGTSKWEANVYTCFQLPFSFDKLAQLQSLMMPENKFLTVDKDSFPYVFHQEYRNFTEDLGSWSLPC